MAGGTYMAWSDDFKPLHDLTIGDTSFTAYVGLIALVANIVVTVVVSLVVSPSHGAKGSGEMAGVGHCVSVAAAGALVTMGPSARAPVA